MSDTNYTYNIKKEKMNKSIINIISLLKLNPQVYNKEKIYEKNKKFCYDKGNRKILIF